ncbi:MAG: Ig-like domain-containing protein [Saprospiraceae bacterium]|nr:Ig-like domain-containing protein [Saprospiraceae bacterium]
MKKYNFTLLIKSLPFGMLFLFLAACQRDNEDLSPVTYPTNPEVFIEGFSPGLNYAAFGGSVPTAFDVDTEVTYNATSQTSMRFEVPDAGDPRGAYAGGAYFTDVPRDLSGYDALTFWAKASQPANIDVVGFGNDLGASKYQATISGLPVTTNWQKFIIPIPDPSKLTAERGMFLYSEGPENGRGYTFWVDELKFEKLGTIAHPQHAILNGEEQTETSFVGVTKTIGGLSSTYNLPSGINQSVNIAPAYFEFASSDPSIATVNESGLVTVAGGPGSAKITATVGGVTAKGSLTLLSVGDFQAAPVPSRDAANVISIFSDAYTNVPVNYYNGYWAPFQTTQSADFTVNGDDILHYTNFNFVGIEFSSPVINASSMTHLHVDIYIPNALPAAAQFKIEVVDFGTGGTGSFTRAIPAAQSQQWISLDIPFTNFAGLSNRSNLAQIIFVDVSENISSFFADNVYLYNNGTPPAAPTTAAPTPTHPAGGVIAVFSDAYSTIAGTDLNPNWGQATVVTQTPIQGNNTLKYAGLNYQGIQLGSPQNVSAMNFLHLDFWTANSTSLNVYIISPGPVETPFTLTVPTAGWSSIDIPMSAFAPVNLGEVIQLKFDGNGDIFLDNIYFRN